MGLGRWREENRQRGDTVVGWIWGVNDTERGNRLRVVVRVEIPLWTALDGLLLRCDLACGDLDLTTLETDLLRSMGTARSDVASLSEVEECSLTITNTALDEKAELESSTEFNIER